MCYQTSYTHMNCVFVGVTVKDKEKSGSQIKPFFLLISQLCL